MKLIRILLILIFFFTPITYAKTVELTIENYNQAALNYMIKSIVINGVLNLPASIPSGNPGMGTASVEVDETASSSSGIFKIGYNQDHYCEFSYSLKKDTVGWQWFMRPIRWVGMDGISCAVDPDAHQFIIFQAMGKSK